MSNLSLDPKKSRRRRLGPVIIGILFFLAACGVSLDFLAEQFGANRAVTDTPVTQTPAKSGDVGSVKDQQAQVAPKADPALPSVTMPVAGKDGEDGDRAVAGDADPFVDDMSMVGPESPIGRSDSTLPFSNPWPNEKGHARKRQASAKGSGVDPADEPFEMDRNQKRSPAQVDYETAPEDLKISTEPSKWKGGAQLLPSPMYVSQLTEKKSLDIRGGGWVIIDVNRSQIMNVELFKSAAKAVNERRVIEAKYVDGSAVVNPMATGFTIARGVPGLQPGGFEVFENPPCLVRFSNASEEEICEVTVRGNKSRYKFTPPVIPEGVRTPDFIFTDVSYDMGRGVWKKIISFNESFHPIGDPNRDGYPDFIVESVTGYDESGVHVLLMSHAHDGIVEYTPYNARFKGH